MTAYLFPGQGSQFVGMGLDLYQKCDNAKELFETANTILGFRITDILFNGTSEDLRQTEITQPAIFLHSIIHYFTQITNKPDAVAGHSLGEISALVANGALTFENGLQLVSTRAKLMQDACIKNPSTMAAVLGLNFDDCMDICKESTDHTNEIVGTANDNAPNQIVISGTIAAIHYASNLCVQKGGKVIKLPVGGAFHSPLMQKAQDELANYIQNNITFSNPEFPIYQNVTSLSSRSISEIKKNLIAQVTAPVLWTSTIMNMKNNNINNFVEMPPGKVLSGLVTKILSKINVSL